MLPLKTIGAAFFDRVLEQPDARFCITETGAEHTWRDMASQVLATVRGLRALGLEQGDVIGICATNRLEWLCADLAMLSAGYVSMVLLPTSSDRVISTMLEVSGARAVFANDASIARRVGAMRGRVPGLRHVIAFEGADDAGSDVLSMVGLHDLGSRGAEVAPDALVASVGLDDPATIPLTSGSTGLPKGIVRTHGNVAANIARSDAWNCRPGDVIGLVLGLSHMFGREGFLRTVYWGATLGLIEKAEHAIRLGDVAAIAPRSFSVVPRVLLRLWAEMEERDPELAAQLEEIREAVTFDGDEPSAGPNRGPSPGPTEDRAALRERISGHFGGKLREIHLGGAATPTQFLQVSAAIELPILGVYGCTEAGPTTQPNGATRTDLDGYPALRLSRVRPGNLGAPYPDTELRISAEDGEVLIRGPGVASEYLTADGARVPLADADGWLHTGDLGEIGARGEFQLTGRKKDTFNTAEGANIYPEHIELALEALPSIRQAVLLGDQRPYLAALLVPDDTAHGGHAIEDVVRREVAALNETLEPYERIETFVLLDAELPSAVRPGEGAKVRTVRSQVLLHFADTIAALYPDEPEPEP